MKHGPLKHTLAFDKPIAVETTNGEPAIDWVEVVRVKARIDPITGREILAAAGVVAESDTRIHIRWRPALADMTAKWRARRTSDGTIYNLRNAPPYVPRPGDEWVLLASTGANQG